jgi:hypothetical protein
LLGYCYFAGWLDLRRRRVLAPFAARRRHPLGPLDVRLSGVLLLRPELLVAEVRRPLPGGADFARLSQPLPALLPVLAVQQAGVLALAVDHEVRRVQAPLVGWQLS